MLPQQKLFVYDREHIVDKSSTEIHENLEKKKHQNLFMLPQLENYDPESELMPDRDRSN